MSEPIYYLSTGQRVPTDGIVKDQIGRDWKLSFACKPGIRTNDPEGEVWVMQPNQTGHEKQKPFALYFFPDLTFEEPAA